MFPNEYISRGQCTYSKTSVSLWSDMHHSKNLNNIPCGHIQQAYWQGNTVHVIMEDGWHYVYEDFGGYASKWR